ncbi:uncharacterized protein K441DRAFT_731003 [Cenococcum geophilum 1.58]|uniref:uncharacterized protein n=1 Tax=Cenococcum geophilum 1.58 TaxID=794803 RepID=UPI00358EE9D4|nr:hypothetical protein K441DRAFT_731003 [Cenococcum geophilum 1.58]
MKPLFFRSVSIRILNGPSSLPLHPPNPHHLCLRFPHWPRRRETLFSGSRCSSARRWRVVCATICSYPPSERGIQRGCYIPYESYQDNPQSQQRTALKLARRKRRTGVGRRSLLWHGDEHGYCESIRLRGSILNC